jgi:hypothetical protein
MAKTVADVLLERRSKWGVRRIYGYPGLYDANPALTIMALASRLAERLAAKRIEQEVMGDGA